MSLPDGDVFLDHIAVATNDLEQSVQIFTDLGLSFLPDREVVEEQKVKTAFAKVDGRANLELLEPLDQQGPIQDFLDKKGPGIHHLCFRVESVERTTKRLQEKGFRFIYTQAKKGAHNCLINFIHPKSTGGILIEVSEKQG